MPDTGPVPEVLVICTGHGRHHTDPGNPCELARIVGIPEGDGSMSLYDRAFRAPGKWTQRLQDHLGQLGRSVADLDQSPFRTTPQRPIRADEDIVWTFSCRVCDYRESIPNAAVNHVISGLMRSGGTVLDMRPADPCIDRRLHS